MKVIVRDRRRGKTSDLIRLAAAEGLCIVCPVPALAAEVARMAAGAGLDIPAPVTWQQFIDGGIRGRRINGFAIDDLDICVQSMSTAPVFAASLTGGQ
jgi:hypothetical protein